MKRLFLFGTILLLSLSGGKAQEKNDWENEHVFGINKLEPHSSFFGYESEELALVNDRSRSNRFKSLNGDWKFYYSKNLASSPEDFYTSDYNSGDWKTILVPSNWQMHGYGFPIYVNQPYENDVIQQAQFAYEKNGVRIHVQYFEYQQNKRPALVDLKNIARARLKSTSNLSLLAVQMDEQSIQARRGFTYEAQYLMPFLSKKINYSLSHMVRANKHWIISTSYKVCDQKGQKLVQKFKSFRFTDDA